jgi:hypothetical protein
MNAGMAAHAQKHLLAASRLRLAAAVMTSARLSAPRARTLCAAGAQRLPAVSRPLQLARQPCATFATRAELAERAKAASEPFDAQVGRLFDALAAGLGDMAAVNAGFSVQRDGPRSLTIDGGNGKAFTLTAEPASRRVCLNTPKHANVYYVPDSARPGVWVGAADGHFLVELLTRELIYHLKGFPTF